MAKNQIILSVLLLFHLQSIGNCDFSSIDYFSKDVNFRVLEDLWTNKPVVVGMPESDVYRKRFHFNYIYCDLTSCELVQHCFNCPKSEESRKCNLTMPYDMFSLGRIILKSYGDDAEYVIVDWVSEAKNTKQTRKIQLFNMTSCLSRDISINLTGNDAGKRKIILDPLPMTKSFGFDFFYIDIRNCPDNGWVKVRYNEDGEAIERAQCIFGLEKSYNKIVTDVAMAADFSEIILEKNEGNWTLYQLKNHSNQVSELYKARARSDDVFDIPRLDMHADNFGSLCWLPDIELSYSLNCTIFRAEPKYMKQLSLNFHYEVRDFELKVVDFKRIYALTSSGDETDCVYDLWIFDINGRMIDGPLRIQGPDCCIFKHRLEPRPVLTQLNRDQICVSFVFERSTHNESSHEPKLEAGFLHKRFTAMTECFVHSN